MAYLKNIGGLFFELFIFLITTNSAIGSPETVATPVITDVTPNSGGTEGGVVITITGTGFMPTGNTVSIAASPCEIVTERHDQIECKTGAVNRCSESIITIQNHLPHPNGEGLFWYVCRWSHNTTWGLKSLPSKEDNVLIPKGQTILLDTSVTVNMIRIDGHLKIDEHQNELHLGANHILIAGGQLQVTNVFGKSAVIEFFGEKEMPLDHTWVAPTLVSEGTEQPTEKIMLPILPMTAALDGYKITLQDAVKWDIGGLLQFYQVSNEVNSPGSIQNIPQSQTRTIERISSDNRTFTLNANINPDIEWQVTYLGQPLVHRGSNGVAKSFQTCPKHFNPDQFQTQTCFQGTFLPQNCVEGKIMDTQKNEDVSVQVKFYTSPTAIRQKYSFINI